MLHKIDNQGKAISESELSNISSEIKLKFPVEYDKFLLKYNGGSPEPDAIPIKGHMEEIGTVQTFFGVDREIESSDLRWNYDEYKNRIPSSFLPIACSDTNDLICLVLSETQYGSVVFWDAMNESGKDSLDNIYKVADSFTQFLELLFYD